MTAPCCWSTDRDFIDHRDRDGALEGQGRAMNLSGWWIMRANAALPGAAQAPPADFACEIPVTAIGIKRPKSGGLSFASPGCAADLMAR
jgi:hypothetical protein